MKINSETEMLALGERIAALLKAGDVVTLSGPLSAGKTTMVRGILAGLGHEGDVPSPSFAIVQPYEMLLPPIWHADLYRIENTADIAELGLEDIGDESVLIVEWPEHAGPGAWPEALALSLEVDDEGARALTARVPASWEGRWPPQ